MNKIVVWVLSAACVGHAVLVAVREFPSVRSTARRHLNRCLHHIEGAQSVTSGWDSTVESCVVVRSSNVTMFIFYMYSQSASPAPGDPQC